MRTIFTDLDIKFSIGNVKFTALNIAFECIIDPIPKHSHSNNSYEIHYIPHGYGWVKINNIQYDIIPNTLYITGPHVEHEQVPMKENPMTEYCIYLKTEVKKGSGKSPDLKNYITLFTETKFWYGQDCQDIYNTMKFIFFELENKYTGYMTQVETLLQQCVIKLIRNYDIKKEIVHHFEPINLFDNKYIILEKYFLFDYRNITLKKLSERLGLSTRQTERLLKKYYGKTFLQKRTDTRMSAAAILLADDKNSITNIANELGYSSVEHFSNAFKRFYDKSPRDYRKDNVDNLQ